MKKKLAWKVTDEDGQGCIVFHSHGLAARRLGAGELGSEYEYVECCREKQYDEYSELGKVPTKVLLENGWWFECHYCGMKVYDDRENEDGTEFSLDDVVIDEGSCDDNVYCNQSCKDNHDKEIEDKNTAFEGFKKTLLEKHSDLEWVEFKGGYPYLGNSATFKFEGSMYTGQVQQRRYGEDLEWFVNREDLQAWNDYNRGIRSE